MAQFDMRNNAEFGLGLSATLSGTAASAGDWIDMQGWEALTFTRLLMLTWLDWKAS